MSKNYKAILFDLDGTLLDTSPGILKGLDHLVETMNLEKISEENKYKFIGPPLSYTFPNYLGLKGENTVKGIKIYRDYCRNFGYKDTEDYSGVKEMLEELKKNNFKLIVVTMKEQSMAEKTLEAAGFSQFFDQILGTDDISDIKKKDLVIKAIDDNNLDKSEVVLIGDTDLDAKGAMESNIDYIPALYGYGYSHNNTSDDYPYITKINTPSDLINYLGKKEGTNGTF